METIAESLKKIGIIPVIKIDDPDRAVPLARALIAGGIPCAEITFRTAQAEEAIRRIRAEVPDILAGAGTVLTPSHVDRAVDAGAVFAVSPGYNPKTVERCREKGIPIFPGCSTPSDLEIALEAGLTDLKFFPAEQAGGLDYIKALSGPFPQVRFIPTGGINASNIASYLAFDKVLACGGSWMAGADLINSGNYEGVAALCREALRGIMGFSLAHVGINTQNAGEALKAAGLFEALFGFAPKDGNSSVFAGDGVEIMKSPYLGKNGHIAIAVNSLIRAKAYLERRGAVFNDESAKIGAGGEVIAVYLRDEIAGFAVHLVQKKK
ncbi:MAG: bifunctional 4-hydroxy-2-oxoglutarate aldolase/2-dehydro-3-deoxy-phosphogluconate aldolase [Treponema sp.]|jgi:2-dehydro-3-deoxyphosphogluconate aldolase/(4S)-4-hydroxy-2-oxoglutarate aldolase|nr:bifunctional 4-hydroxy-2-oxoglutarate aldolase/2-dehydro-3-deoxy-phosphogluconate aldolase [Treponema sp.]